MCHELERTAHLSPLSHLNWPSEGGEFVASPACTLFISEVQLVGFLLDEKRNITWA